MFTRVQNRNTGYSENLFSHNSRIENNTLNSIDGATALKLDEGYQLKEEEQSNPINSVENNIFNENNVETEQLSNNIPSGVSIESASYIENNNLEENEGISTTPTIEEEYTPKLFSEEQNYKLEENNSEDDFQENNDTEQLFDQDINEEEDFEIPAFLRKQKF